MGGRLIALLKCSRTTMASTMKTHTAVRTQDDSFGLPAESLDRLSALAANALRDTNNTDAIKVWVLPLPAGPLLPGPFACNDTLGTGTPRVLAVLPDVRAFVLIPLKHANGVPMEDHTRDGGELALFVTSPSPRVWTGAEIDALDAVAATTATELRLRVELARQARAAEQLRKDPLHDPITELGSRELFLDRVGQALIRYARAPEQHMAVMSLTVDQSADIAHAFGYDAVNEVLRELANRLKVVVRNGDSAARLGGDEFGVLLEYLRDNSDAARVANRMHESLRTPIATSAGDFMVSSSIGIALSELGLDSPARLIRLAGLARERARATGAAYEIFDPQMQKHAESRLNSEMELRRAVEGDQFELYYQPIIRLDTGRIDKVEALLRWHHPKRGLTAAAEFIPLAEQTGLIVPMNWSVLAQGCRQLEEWLTQTPAGMTMSINITAANLSHASMLDRIRDELTARALGPGSLNVEITEGVLIEDPKQAKKILGELRALGVGVHLDDFGTGYSSLNYLHELPLDAIKIDRRFIARLGGSEADGHVVSTIRDLARSIGVPVIAEGVETEEQLADVRRLGCEYAQGYFFSRPLPHDEMAALMHRNPVWL
jgi:diguanylate cyclase (GGDEF)-like protein